MELSEDRDVCDSVFAFFTYLLLTRAQGSKDVSPGWLFGGRVYCVFFVAKVVY